MKIVAVTAGTVHKLQPEDKGTYGKHVVIKDSETRFFLYAHCHSIEPTVVQDGKVYERQLIASVGATGNANPKHPHLHFEVSKLKLPTNKGAANETKPGEPVTQRMNPFKVLESLGPWGTSQAFFVGGRKVDDKEAARQQRLVDRSGGGGFFPLGANNIWHGGVHIHMPSEAKLVAPLDGEVVAARLDPDPTRANGAFGSSNFVLLRHVIPEAVFEVMQREAADPAQDPKTKPKADKVPGVGGRYDNDPALVLEVKARLHELGLYEPDPASLLEDGTKLDSALEEAIDAFQDGIPSPHSNPKMRWPDRSIKQDGSTWRELFPAGDAGDSDNDDNPEEAEPEPELDPTRIVYCLLMHLAAKPFDADLAKKLPWLTSAKVPLPDAVERAREKEARERAIEDIRDQAEARSHTISKSVGAGEEEPEDVRWVQRRLQTFGLYDIGPGGPSGTVDATLTAAIVTFQRAHVYLTNPSKADGVVSRGSKGPQRTARSLAKTVRELSGAGPGGHPAGSEHAVDPAVVQALEQQGTGPTTEVVTDLRARVGARDALGLSARARGFSKDGGSTLMGQVHWEFFSEHPLFATWDALEDSGDDLTADAPAKLLDEIEALGIEHAPFRKDGIISLAELNVFFQGAKALPLRRTRCKFRSEWGMNLDTAMTRLAARGWNTTGLADQLRRYQWWDAAQAVLPASPHVWHYNPIQFIAEYQAILDTFAPPEPKDPALFAVVGVTVFNAAGGRAPNQEVRVKSAAGPFDETMATSRLRGKGATGGESLFVNVPVGAASVTLVGIEGYTLGFSVVPGKFNELALPTQLEGNGPPTGTLHVIVRRYTLGIAKEPRSIELWRFGAAVAAATSGHNGKATFDDLAFGEYEVRCVDASATATPVSVTIDKVSTRSVALKLDPPIGTLNIVVAHEGAPAAQATLAVTAKDHGVVPGAPSQTDDNGEAQLVGPQGTYFIGANGGKPRRARLRADLDLTFKIELPEPAPVRPPPPEPTGVLAVAVTQGGEPLSAKEVAVSDATGFLVDLAKTDDDGIARFRLPPGPYEIATDDVITDADVQRDQTNEIEMEIP